MNNPVFNRNINHPSSELNQACINNQNEKTKTTVIDNEKYHYESFVLLIGVEDVYSVDGVNGIYHMLNTRECINYTEKFLISLDGISHLH